jgi:hypothetical protein
MNSSLRKPWCFLVATLKKVIPQYLHLRTLGIASKSEAPFLMKQKTFLTGGVPCVSRR